MYFNLFVILTLPIMHQSYGSNDPQNNLANWHIVNLGPFASFYKYTDINTGLSKGAPGKETFSQLGFLALCSLTSDVAQKKPVMNWLSLLALIINKTAMFLVEVGKNGKTLRYQVKCTL